MLEDLSNHPYRELIEDAGVLGTELFFTHKFGNPESMERISRQLHVISPLREAAYIAGLGCPECDRATETKAKCPRARYLCDRKSRLYTKVMPTFAEIAQMAHIVGKEEVACAV